MLLYLIKLKNIINNEMEYESVSYSWMGEKLFYHFTVQMKRLFISIEIMLTHPFLDK